MPRDYQLRQKRKGGILIDSSFSSFCTFILNSDSPSSTSCKMITYSFMKTEALRDDHGLVLEAAGSPGFSLQVAPDRFRADR